MQDNSKIEGTNSEIQGLTESEAEKLFAAVYNGEDVSKVTSNTPEPPVEQEKALTEVEVKNEAAPAEGSTEQPGNEVNKGNDQQPDPNANSNPYAWVDSLTDADMKAKVSKILAERLDLEHRWKSDNGRFRSAVQTVNQLKQELEKFKETKPQEEAPKPTKAAEIQIDIPDDPEWRKIAEADPELARAVDKRAKEIIEARLKNLAPDLSKQAEERVRAAVAPYEARQREEQFYQEMQQLQRDVPNLNEVVTSQQYKDWVQYYATPEIRELALNADSYTKAITVLKQYDYDMRIRGGFKPAQEAQPQKPIDNTKAELADKLAKEREDKLNKAVGPAATRQPTPAGDPKKGISTLEEQEQIFLNAWKT